MEKMEKLRRDRGLNSEPSAIKADALPVELSHHAIASAHAVTGGNVATPKWVVLSSTE